MKNRKIIILLLAICAVSAGVYFLLHKPEEIVEPVVVPEPEVVVEKKEEKQVEEKVIVAPPKPIVKRDNTVLKPKESKTVDLTPDFDADLQRSKELYKLKYTTIEVGPKPEYVVTRYPNNETVLFAAASDRVSKIRFKNNELTLINSIPLKNNKRFSADDIKHWVKSNNPNASYYADSLYQEMKDQRPVRLVEGPNQQFYVSQGHQIFAFTDEEEEFHLSATMMSTIFSLPAKHKAKGDYIVSLKVLDNGDLVFLTQNGLLGKVNRRLRKFQSKFLNKQERFFTQLNVISDDMLFTVSDKGIYTVSLNDKLENSVVNRTPMHVTTDFPAQVFFDKYEALVRVRVSGSTDDKLYRVILGADSLPDVFDVEGDKFLYVDEYKAVLKFVDKKQQNGVLQSIQLSGQLVNTLWQTSYPLSMAVFNANTESILALRSVKSYRRLESLAIKDGALLRSITQENSGSLIPFNSNVYRLGDHVALYGSLFKINAIEFFLPEGGL